MSGTFQVHVRYLSGTFQIHVRYISGKCQIHVRYMSSTGNNHNLIIIHFQGDSGGPLVCEDETG